MQQTLHASFSLGRDSLRFPVRVAARHGVPVTRALRLYSRVALRNVWRNARRSVLTVTAIAFGLVCLVVFQALKVGLHREMVRSTVHLDAGAVQVHAAGYEANLAALKPLPDPDRVERALSRAGAEAVAFRLKSPALLLAGPKSAAVMLEGVQPERESAITFIAERLTAGEYLRAGKGALLGEVLAESLQIGVGDEVVLLVQDGTGRAAPRRRSVAGLYRTALRSFDRSHIYLPLDEAQAMLGVGSAVTEAVAAAPEGEGRALARRVAEELPKEGYLVQPWQEVAPEVDQIIRLNDATMGLLILIVFAIVAMGIANTMMTVIFERFHELGVLATLGTGPAGIFSMILLESLFLGVVASVAGSALGVAACTYLGRHGIDLTALTSANEHFATSHVLRADLRSVDLALANAVTLLTALAAGLYPAWKAVRLEPVEAIRRG